MGGWILFALEWIGMMVLLWRQNHRSKTLRRWDATTQCVLSEILQGLRSGYGLRTTLCRLSESAHPQVAQMGRYWQYRFRSGFLQLQMWAGSEHNLLLQSLWAQVHRFLRTGVNPIPWLERTHQFLIQKQHYHRRLRTKTTQLRLQVYLLLGFSWISFGITLWIFPGSFFSLFQDEQALGCLILALGIQIGSIFLLNRVLDKGIPGSL